MSHHEHDERCLMDCYRCRKPIRDFRDTLKLPDGHTIHKSCVQVCVPRVVYDELGAAEIDADWVDADGDRWSFKGPFWEWLSDDGWAVAVPMVAYAPYTEIL